MNKFASRKFGLTIAVLIIASIFAATKILTGGEWVTVSSLILGMYAGANVWEKKDAKSS